MSETTMSEDIAAAMAEHEETTEDAPIETTEETVSKTPEIETETSEITETVSETPEIETKTPEITENVGLDDAAGTNALKAPAGWTPKLRESWSKVPAEVQAQISAREQEMADNMANTSDAKNTHDRMTVLAQSFAPLMAAEGIRDPVQAAEGMFNTVAQLRMGSSQQKAKVIADLIQSYGVDIATLDNTIVGNTPEPSKNDEVERIIAERMAPMNDFFKQQQEQRSEQERAQAQSEVQEFSKTAEFMYDPKVRNDMADFIDLAAARGQKMGVQEAYQKALATNPEILKILSNRQVVSGNAGVAAKRAAASSINGRKTGSGDAGTPRSLRDSISGAWDEYSN